MLVNIQHTKELLDLEKETGKTATELVNKIVGIHLNAEQRKRFIAAELECLFNIYRKKHNQDIVF